jgi:hypothetical protein
MNECHFIKMIAEQEFIVEILEEIIEYDQENNKIIALLVIIESALLDLDKLCKIWLNK